jgi:hypothetical protein
MDKAEESEELVEEAEVVSDLFADYEFEEGTLPEEEEPPSENIREVMTPESLTEELRSRSMLSEGEYVGTFRATGHSIVVVLLPTGRKLTL